MPSEGFGLSEDASIRIREVQQELRTLNERAAELRRHL